MKMEKRVVHVSVTWHTWMYQILLPMVQTIFINFFQKEVQDKPIQYMCGKTNYQRGTMYNCLVHVGQTIVSYGQES